MQLSRAHRRALVAVIGGAVLACTDTPTHPMGCGDSNVTVDVSTSLSAAQTPRFDWSPRCGVTNLTVTLLPSPPGNDPVVVWNISAPESSKMGPPVSYGVIPRGATAQSAAQPLVSGVRYRVNILTTVGGDAIAAMAEKTFTR